MKNVQHEKNFLKNGFVMIFYFLYILLYIFSAFRTKSLFLIDFFCIIPIILMIIHSIRIIKENKSIFCKRNIAFIIILLCSCLWIYYESHLRWNLETYYDAIRVLGSRLIILLSALIAYQIIICNDKIEKIFWNICTTIGLFFMVLLPVRIVPDENVHIYTAYRMSEIFLGNASSSSEYISMRKTDQEMFVDPIEMQHDEEMIEKYYLRSSEKPCKDYTENFNQSSIIRANDIAYVLPAIGISVGKICGLNGFYTLLLGRLSNFVLYILLGYWAIKLIPFCKLIPFFIALLPMSLQQGMSYSYDSIIISSSLFVVSSSLSIYYDTVQSNRSKKILVISIALFSLILLLLKGHAYFLIGLFPLFLYLNKKYDLNKYVKPTIIFLIGVVALYFLISLVFLFCVKSNLVTEPVNPIAWSNNDPGYTIQYFINHPIDLFYILGKTLFVNFLFYWQSSICSYLGWLNINVPYYYTFIYSLLMIIGVFENESSSEYYLDKSIILYNSLSGIITIIGIVFALIIAWTPMQYSTAMGVQGRYFIPSFILFLLLLKNIKIRLKIDVKYALVIFYIFITTFYLVSLMPKI